MPLKDGFYYTAGIGFLALAKAKHVLQGYASPKPFDLSDTERCIDYDIEVAEQWLSRLAEYRPQPDPLRGKEVLELGPINATIHKIDEHIEIQQLDRLTSIYTSLLEKLFDSD